MTTPSIPRKGSRVQAFKKALHTLALSQRLKRYGILRRGESTYRAQISTKLDLAVEMLAELLGWGYGGMTVLFDAWYAWPCFLAKLVELGYHFVTRARWDSGVRVDGKKMTMQEFFVQRMRTYKRRGQGATFYNQQTLELVEVGEVKAVCVRYWCERKGRFREAVLITDRLTWTGPEVLEAYLGRSRVEQAIVVQFRLAHLGEQIRRGQDQVVQILYRSLRQLYDSTGLPSWETLETLFQSIFELNYQT